MINFDDYSLQNHGPYHLCSSKKLDRKSFLGSAFETFFSSLGLWSDDHIWGYLPYFAPTYSA
jgi:hypothetical protein